MGEFIGGFHTLISDILFLVVLADILGVEQVSNGELIEIGKSNGGGGTFSEPS